MTLAARIIALAQLTLQDPRRATRALLAEAVPMPARTLGLLLVAVISALLATLQIGVQSVPVDPFVQALLASPFRAALLQWLVIALSVILIHRVGRAFGGKGNFADALLVMVWLQFLFIGPQVLQLLAAPISSALAGVIALGGLVLFFWLVTSFIAELHGFHSAGLVFLGVIGTAVVVGFVIALIVVLLLGPEAFLPHV